MSEKKVNILGGFKRFLHIEIFVCGVMKLITMKLFSVVASLYGYNVRFGYCAKSEFPDTYTIEIYPKKDAKHEK